MIAFALEHSNRQVDSAMATVARQLKKGAQAFRRRLAIRAGGDRLYRLYWRPDDKFWVSIERFPSQHHVCFGVDDPSKVPPSRQMKIAIQINPSRIGERCEGMILREGRHFYYAHTGRLGGGGQANGNKFAEFLNRKPVLALAGSRKYEAFVVSRIGVPELPRNIRDYVYEAAAFRDALESDPDALYQQVQILSRKPIPKPRGTERPRKVKAPARTEFRRDKHVWGWVLRNAKGKCELCRNQTFRRPDGGWFLEVHHPVWLSQLGSDTVTNAVALCPNCHRRLHGGGDAVAQLTRLYSKVKRLRKESPRNASE